MLVVVYHLHLNTAGLLVGIEASWISDFVGEFGAAGVHMFFVLSGFVIAMSLRGAPLSWPYVGRFALRRSVRLDPPYWAAIALCLGMNMLAARLFADLADRGHVDPGQVLAHLFYVQEILGYEHISAVFWTLCIEIQFYLFFIFVLRFWAIRDSPQKVPRAAVTTVALVMLVSLLIDATKTHLPVPGLFVRHWHMFATGVLVCWVLHGDVDTRWAVAAVAGQLLILGWMPNFSRIMTLVAVLVLVAGPRWGAVASMLRSTLSQYLGRISYSIYLTHAAIGWSTISVMKRLLGSEPSLWHAVASMTAGLAASVISADLLNRLIERPAIRLSKRIELPVSRH